MNTTFPKSPHLIAILLLTTYAAPRITQDLHRVFGHHPASHHLHCACVCDTNEIAYKDAKTHCPLCEFGFFTVEEAEPGLLLPSLGFKWIAYRQFMHLTEVKGCESPYSGRGPPLFFPA